MSRTWYWSVCNAAGNGQPGVWVVWVVKIVCINVSSMISVNSIYHSLIISREVLILTLSILPGLQGCISWYIPQYGLMMREWTYTASSRDVLGCTSPRTSRFPSALEMSLGLRPRDISLALRNLLVVGDVQSNASLLSAVYTYNMVPGGQRWCEMVKNGVILSEMTPDEMVWLGY